MPDNFGGNKADQMILQIGQQRVEALATRMGLTMQSKVHILMWPTMFLEAFHHRFLEVQQEYVGHTAQIEKLEKELVILQKAVKKLKKGQQDGQAKM